MEHEKIKITAMTKEYSRLISLWKYDGEYSLYDEDEGNPEGCMDGTHHACTDEAGELIGYFSFGEDARIPTIEEYIFDDEYLDVGLGLRPDLCGKRMGLSFLINGLDYAKMMFNTTHFRLSVAAFNERAIKVYKKAGFYTEQEVTHSRSMSKFFIMKCIRQ